MVDNVLAGDDALLEGEYGDGSLGLATPNFNTVILFVYAGDTMNTP
jgi:hypothetical protein